MQYELSLIIHVDIIHYSSYDLFAFYHVVKCPTGKELRGIGKEFLVKRIS